MAQKIMPYILPIASIIVIAAIIILFKPQATGFFIASPQVNAEIKITADEILPENAEIHIFLEKDNAIVKEISISSVNGFVNQFPAQTGLEYKYGNNYEIAYEGFGYLGGSIFNVGLDANNLKGKYILKTRISYEGKVISETGQEIEI